MKKLISNSCANFYLNAAETLGLSYTVINDKAALARIENGSKALLISANALDVNSHVSAVLATNKKKTSLMLQQNNLPAPKFETFTKSERAIKYALEMFTSGKSTVIKPLAGSLSVGITVKPSTPDQIRQAVSEAFIGSSDIIIEEYISGLHYRVTVLDDEVIAVTQRLAAHVVTDGKKSVHQLITDKNSDRSNQKLPKIHLRKKDLDYLAAEKIDLSRIYPAGMDIMLQLGCDLEIGGERARIDINTIPQINHEFFIQAAKSLTLRFAGLDYISPDITLPYTEVKNAINEINAAPDSDVHYRDATPFSNYAAERIIQKLFKDEEDEIKPQKVQSYLKPIVVD